MTTETLPEFTVPTKQAAMRVLGEQLASRELKVGHMRKSFGDRLPKGLAAEVEQMETEIEGLKVAIAILT